MIKKYFDFRYFSLLESILKVDPDFNKLIKSISDTDTIAKTLLSLMDKDINTNVNYLKPSDKNDDMKFLNDTQVQRFIDAGQDPFDRAINSAKIGRTVRQILISNGITVTDTQIEKFVNTYKNSWDKLFKKTGEDISVVSGEDIRYWYLEDKYVPGGGQLNSSCMRYKETQSFLNIYVENSEVCQLVILVDDSNKLLGRALLWKLIDGINKYQYYLDRIYTRFDNDVLKIADWFKDYIKATDDYYKAHFFGRTSGCKVQLKNWKFKKYPYMDTLSILNYDSGILGTYEIEDRSKLQLFIQNTNGEAHAPGYKWSEHYQNWISSKDSVYIDSLGDYYLKTDCIKDYKDTWVYKDHSVYSDYYRSFIDKDNAIDLDGFGLVDSDDIITVYDSIKDDRPSSPKKFLLSKIDGSKYIKVEICWNDYWINSKFCLWNARNSNNIIKTDRFNIEYTTLYLVENDEFTKSDRIFRDSIDNFLVYNDSWGIQDKYTKFPIFQDCYDRRQDTKRKYCTSETLEYFNFEIGDRPAVYMTNEDFYKGYHKMNYQYSVDIIKKNIEFIDGSDPQPLLKKLQEINEYLYSSDIGSYRQVNDSYEGMKEFGSYASYFNSILSGLYKDGEITKVLKSDQSIETLAKDVNGQLTFDFEDSNGNVISVHRDDEIDILKIKMRNFIDRFEELILYYTYWFIFLNDRDYAGYRFLAYQNRNSIETNNVCRNLIFNYCRYSDVGGQFARAVNDIRRKIANEYEDVVVFTLEEKDIERDSEQYEKSIEMYNNFLTFLK